MGRRTYSDRVLVENCHSLCVKDLNTQFILLDDKFSLNIIALKEAPLVILLWNKQYKLIKVSTKSSISNDLQVGACKYFIKLLNQACNFGGYRMYFSCPCCGKKVAKLYCPPNSFYFYCRSCHNLSYRKQKKHNKLIDKLSKMTRAEMYCYLSKKFRK